MPFDSFWIAAAILLPICAVPVVLLAAPRLGSSVGWIAAAACGISTGILVYEASRLTGTPKVFDIPWIPSIGLNLSLLIDGLSMFYALIISGVGTLVCVYAVGYLSDAAKAHGRFYACLLTFTGSMLATVLSDNLLGLFVSWEITGVASFLLIGFYHGEEQARLGARRALIVTATTGLCMLVGIIMLGISAGTYSLTELSASAPDWIEPRKGWFHAAFLLVMVGAFGKSAQFPFHFWLPGAMAAPTPVSAYLHSATMVKLGVFLTARIFFGFAHLERWGVAIIVISFVTMLLGAYLALRSNDLKEILAYSTVSQLGFLIALYPLAASTGVRLDFYHILNHVLYKGALFMVAGVVDHATSVRDVRRLGGLAREMPLTAAICGVAAAAMAGIPFTTGFVSKEMMLETLYAGRGTHSAASIALIVALGLSGAMLVAFAARVFFGVFFGPRPAELAVHRPSWALQGPPLVLVLACLVFGMFPGWLQSILGKFTVGYLHAPGGEPLALWHGVTRELLTSAAIVGMGAALYMAGRKSGWSWAKIPSYLRFDVAFESAHDLLLRAAKRLTLALRADWPPAYLPIVISFLLLVPGWALFTRGFPNVDWHLVRWAIHPVRLAVVGLTTGALLGVIFLRRWSAQLVALSIAGFFITFYFVLYKAPDLAMTQILIESASIVMMLLLLARFPSSAQIGVRIEFRRDARHLMRVGLSLGVGLLMSILVIFANINKHPEPIGEKILEMSELLAAGRNAVNTILVDFRGFDTFGEITVLLTATLGGLGLMMRYKQRARKDPKPPPGFLLTDARNNETD